MQSLFHHLSKKIVKNLAINGLRMSTFIRLKIPITKPTRAFLLRPSNAILRTPKTSAIAGTTQPRRKMRRLSFGHKKGSILISATDPLTGMLVMPKIREVVPRNFIFLFL
jgi:hypothetical protein